MRTLLLFSGLGLTRGGPLPLLLVVGAWIAIMVSGIRHVRRRPLL